MDYEREQYELTNQQKNIYLLDKVYDNSGINNIISWLEINDIIDTKLLEKTANIIVQKNDNYRLKFFLNEENPYQVVIKYLHFDVDVINVKDINELETKLKSTRIDLSKDEPFKFYIFVYPNGKGGLSGVFHHMISDAWTMNILIKEIVKYYNVLKNSLVIDMTDNPSYIEYIEEQKELMQSDKKIKNQTYWNELYSKPVDIVSFKEKDDIGIDFVRKEYEVPKSLLESIRRFCKDNKISEYIFALSVYSIYIGRTKNANRFIIGNPILNRSNIKEKQTCGLFMSINPFLVEIDNDVPFVEFAKKISTAQMDMYRHLKYNYDELTQYIKNVNKVYTNIYDVVFSYQNAKIEKKENILDVNTRWVENNKQVESLMIHLKDTDDTGSILFLYDYLVEVFSQKDIDIMHERIIHMMEQALNNSIVKNIDLVLESEKNVLLNEYNNTEVKYDKKSTVVTYFENSVKKRKDEIALVYQDKSLTYNELNSKANQFARVLKKNGVKQRDIVAVVESRSLEMMISMLAIMKLGCSYLPIDIEYPKDRIEYIIQNAHCNCAVTRKEYSNKFEFSGNIVFNNDEILIADEENTNLNVNINPSDLIYLIYTSGSTGNPKGVMLTHQNVVNFIEGTTREINFKNKTIVSVTTISFDIFVLESWLSLSQGCKVVIANEKEQNLAYYLNKLCLNNKVQMIQTTPSRMQILMSDEDNIEFIKNMTDIMIGGESVSYNILEAIRGVTKARVYNMYGPTETTVWSTIKDLTNDMHITIGKPIANTQVYILDNNKILCPIGMPGNLYIGGDGLSKGYYEKTELTNEKFISNPYKNDDIIYETGDMAKWNENGQLICLGRNDFQVKIHGHRIELEEIENVISKIDEINKAVLIVNEKNELIAFYTLNAEVNDNQIVEKIRKEVLIKLPRYMMPSEFIAISNIPKTPNGKTDRKALNNIYKTDYMNSKKVDEKEKFIKPSTETEKILSEEFCKVLNINEISVKSNFFNYGLDSLGSIKIQTSLIKYNIDLNLQDFYRYSSIYELALYIDNKNKVEESDYMRDYILPVKKQDVNDIISNEKNEYKNILLTGVTGLIGIHLLHELLENTDCNIYCIIRKSKEKSIEERLIEKLNFYFDGKHINEIGTRIFLIDGNFNTITYEEIFRNVKDIDCVIHSAAIVKHYGEIENFNVINIEGTKNIINISKKFNSYFYYISSLSVSGNYLLREDNKDKEFTENDLYIGQKYKENAYVYSKFQCEKLVYDEMKNGFEATVLRIGIVTGRDSDGKFQDNINQNALYSRIKSLIQLGCISKKLCNSHIEFTPVDILTKNMVNLIKLKDAKNKIFHLYNHNLILMNDIVECLKKLGINVDIVDDYTFDKCIKEASANEQKKDVLTGIANDVSINKDVVTLDYEFTVNIKSDITQRYLKSVGCNWDFTNKDKEKYLKKVFGYMQKVKFI